MFSTEPKVGISSSYLPQEIVPHLETKELLATVQILHPVASSESPNPISSQSSVITAEDRTTRPITGAVFQSPEHETATPPLVPASSLPVQGSFHH